MEPRISTSEKYGDLQTIVVENQLLRLVILPELGAKLWKILYKPKNFELLWQHPRLKPHQVEHDAVYDECFFGGLDELFPNDIPEQLADEEMPDHGELWTLAWDYEVNGDTVHLWVETEKSRCRVEKWITLRDGDARIYFRHKITNIGAKELPYLWKLHAAMRIDDKARVDMGAKTILVDEFGPTRMGRGGFSYTWPFAKGYDMRDIPPSSAKFNEFQFATEMQAGWCSVTHTNANIGFGLTFDLNVFPSCWTFASYGNWQNLNTLILEPCTGYPISVQEGVEAGTHKILLPLQSIETDVTAVVYEGVREVHHIDAKGNVFGPTS